MGKASSSRTQNSAGNSAKLRGNPAKTEPYRFQPGQSGNPGGRPRKRLIDEVLAEKLETNDSAEAEAIAEAIMAKAKAGDAKAAQFCAERTQGKPTQKVQLEGNLELQSLSDEELQTKLKETMRAALGTLSANDLAALGLRRVE